MKTEISRFCVACSESLSTLPPALEAVAAQFDQRGAELHDVLAQVNDIRARLRSLTEKLASQHAYVLIFGPLKSGKSTLMNAISGAYVSEVTSLPGYPCLVFVQHAENARHSVTRYNGRETAFADGSVLSDVVNDAHHSLVAQIRAAEARGESFDPRTNFPDAIRRIDIRLPVPALADSGTVLVDTPGLYSRMNFGYDVLTREFRDSAACAVFVVKTDNLFLEQVFTEFNQLLDLFSRIFIVVNVDSGKRDLAPDGTLRPSAESEHPEKVLEAFAALSMAGPLRAAYEEGRVRIHAVNLLGAAVAQLSGDGENVAQRAAFDAFQRDLTEFLNSSDYTREFIRDSLRQAATLCEEVRVVAGGAAVGALRRQQERRVEHMRELDSQIAAAGRLMRADWAGMFSMFTSDNQIGAEEATRARVAQMREEMRAALNAWYSDDQSLAELAKAQWSARLVESGRALAAHSVDRIQRLAGQGYGGLQASESLIADMRSLGFTPASCGARALSLLSKEDNLAPYSATVDGSSVPVRKRFLDWLLFRSVSNVRARVFGADGTRRLPAQEKARRFNGASRAEFERIIDATVNDRFPALPRKFSEQLAENYTARCVGEIQATLRMMHDKLVAERAALQNPFDKDAQLLAVAGRLLEQTESVEAEVSLLQVHEAERAAELMPPPLPPSPEDAGYLFHLPQVAPLPPL